MKKRFGWSLIIYMTALGITTQAQSAYRIRETKGVDMKLHGTSSMHAWEMEAGTVEGEAQFDFKSDGEQELASLTALSISIEVKDLKSESNGLNKNAYKALKSDEFKFILYNLTSATVSSEKEGFLLKTRGKLTIAGVTNEIVMDVHGVLNKDGSVTLQGTERLNMTDYKIKPPSFLLGAMKTGDAMTLDFVVVYERHKGA